jgi:hypothetical protein
MKSILYYTNNQLSEGLLDYCLSSLDQTAQELGLEFIAVSWLPVKTKNNIVTGWGSNSHENIYRQILIGLNNCSYDEIYLAEHDVLYPKSHFLLEPSDKIMYNLHSYYLTSNGYTPADMKLLSTLFGRKEVVRNAIQLKMEELLDLGEVKFAEPLENCEEVRGSDPILDIRHESNITGDRFASSYLEEVPYWGSRSNFGFIYDTYHSN